LFEEKAGKAEILTNAADVLWMRLGGENFSSIVPEAVSCVGDHVGVRCSYSRGNKRGCHTKISFNLSVNLAVSSEEVPNRYLTGASYTVLGGSAEAYVGWEYVSRTETLPNTKINAG
jgi:hypothetical protein